MTLLERMTTTLSYCFSKENSGTHFTGQLKKKNHTETLNCHFRGNYHFPRIAAITDTNHHVHMNPVIS